MIKFIGKFTRNGEIVAWKIDDDGAVYNIAYRSLYHEFWFQPLIDFGYKFHDYDCNVTTPDGFPLKDIVEVDDYLSETDIIDLIDVMEQGMLDEKDVAQYFDRDINIEYVEVLQAVDPSINTREEFNSYVDTLIKARESKIMKFNHMPVNAFVNKDALYTLEEIAGDKEAEYRFVKLFDNHLMTIGEDIDKLYKNYVTKEDTDNAIMLSILKGYFSYGIPGLNANITDIRYEANPTAPFNDLSQTMNSAAKLKYAVRNNSDFKMYSEDIKGRDFSSLDGDDETDTNAYIAGSNIKDTKVINLSHDLQSVAYGYKRTPPRIIIDLISEDGIRATFIADCDEAHLYRGTQQMTRTLSMFKYLTLDNVFIPLSRIVYNGRSYIADSMMIRAYIEEKVKESTVVPKYNSSFDLLTGIGVSPYFAPILINNLIKGGAHVLRDIPNIPVFTRLHSYCSDTFRRGFSENIINKYGTGEEDFEEKPLEEQLEFINEEVERLDAMQEYMVMPEIPAGTFKLANAEYAEWESEFEDNEINNVNFVMSLINGDQSISNLAIGKLSDNNFDDERVYDSIYGCYVMLKERDANLKCEEFLTSEISKYIDSNLMFEERDATARGCMTDSVFYSSIMADQADQLLYVTKAYRENANYDLNGPTRDYGFECIVYDKQGGTKGAQIFKSIRDQIRDDMYKKGLSEYVYITADSVASIIFKIYTNKDVYDIVNGVVEVEYKAILMNGQEYNVTIKLGENTFNEIRSGSTFTKRYSSNYDFSENQFSRGNIKCRAYAVNANITPWRVIPKTGFKIPQYNLFVNYFKIEDLKNAYPKSVIDKIESSGAKVHRHLKDEFMNNELFPTMASMFDDEDEVRLAKSGIFLAENEHEDLESYIIRTCNDIREAKAEGKAIMNTILKSDIQYAAFKAYIGDDGVFTEPTMYEEYSGGLTNRHITNMQPVILDSISGASDRQMLTTTDKGLSMERIQIKDIPYETLIWNRPLLEGRFNPNANVYVTRGVLNYMNGQTASISSLDENKLEELCDLGVAIQLGSTDYVIKTLTGLIKVGV